MSTEAVTFRQRWRYRVDTFLSRGSSALFLSLVCAFLAAILLLGAVRFLLNAVVPEAAHDFAYDAWVVFLQLTDPGNMNQDNDTPTVMKSAAVVAGLTGVVIFSALIAFLTTSLDQAIGHLKRGHSQVLETGHTLILGWGPRVIEILRELVEANESERDPVVVILSEEAKESMDEYLRSNCTDRRNTRIVTRSGPTGSVQSLRRVSASEAKSAIVLASCTPSAALDDKLASDARVIKTVLALESLIRKDHELTVVAEVFTDRNRQVVKDVAPGKVSAIDAEEILAKIMVQTSRTSGLSVVYSELLSFEGCEMYFFNDPAWEGMKFDRLQYHFPDGVPIGLRQSDGEIVIRPELDRSLRANDEVLIVAEDDSSIEFRPSQVMIPKTSEIPDRRVERKIERQLVLGWSYKAPIIIREYADYVLQGSEVDVVVKDAPPALVATVAKLNGARGVRVNLVDKDPLDFEDLRSMRPFSYNTVIILPQKPHLDADPERIDSETIVVLLHLRKQQKALRDAGERVETKLITEVLDSANRELVSHAGVNDFIISNRMVSMIFAQISEEPDIERVYDNLFEEDGSEIYVKPAELYFSELPVTCRFGDLMRVAQKRNGEVCIGYKLKRLENDGDTNYGVELIPPKDSTITLGDEDCLVVVAEDDC
jgi:Castor and Pollux, part of voltage-gated ion channel/Calcium-activated potassium channel slowpoke-like RCK domain